MRLGKDKHAIFLIFFLFFTVIAGAQSGKIFKYQPNGDLQKSDVLISDQSITIDYSLPELNVESITNSNGSYFRVSIPGHTHTYEPGKPELPVLSRLISVPEGSVCNVRITDIRTSRVKPRAKRIDGVLFPAQESQTKTIQQRKPEFLIDKELYASRDIIPHDTVKIESLGKVRGKNLSNLYIYPVRYNPHTNSMELITSMKIEVTFSFPDNITTKSLNLESSLFNQSLSKSVLNYDPNEVVPGFSDMPVRMIIITDTSFKKGLEPLIRWKTQKGFKIETLYMGTNYAGTTYTQLKDTLTKIYNSSSETNLPPEYLLIVGSTNIVPYYGSGNISDMYYAEFDGNGDYIPEMYVGRIPVMDAKRLEGVVEKIIQYEKFEYADTNKFYSTAIASAGYDGGYANTMNGQVNYAISNYLTPENKIDEHHFYYSSSMSPTANKDSIIKIINKGSSFINYTGHGDVTSWLHLGFKMDTSKFKNKNMYPFVVSNACLTAHFNDTNSLGNRMLVTRDKGAIGFIGCSNDSYWDEDYYWSVGIGTISAKPTYTGSGLGFYDRLFHKHNESPSDWYYTMGQINYAGNMAVSASTSSRKKYYWETYNLVGDPSIIPIIGNPDKFNVTLPDTLPNGITSFSLDIPPFSYIAVSHFDTLWDASFANISGSVTIDMPGLSNDSCLVVITGQNKIPLIKTIYFSELNGEYINLTSSTINDSQGNNNGYADYGETFFLSLKVSNLGLSDADGLYALISSGSEWITIIQDSVLIGSLPATSEIELSDDLSISLAENVPDNKIITIDLLLKNQNSEKKYTIDIRAHAPNLQILSCIVDRDGDFIADPGETFNLTFKVLNNGSSDISGSFKIESPQDDLFSIMEPSVKNGIFKFGEITEITMTAELSKDVASGSYISLLSTLDCSPYILNKNFSLSVGRVRESFEASSFNIFPWINISATPWIFTETNAYDGSISAKSGAVPHKGTSSLMIKTINTLPDSIKFLYKVSSETNYDFFSFRLNGTEILKKSGEIPWTEKIVPVPKGLNILEWIYKKDDNTSRGMDCAWIDLINFATTAPVSYIEKDMEVARIVTPVQKDIHQYGTISAKVLNVGKDTLNGFYLAYKVNGGIPVKQYFQNKIFPFGDSVTVSFSTKTDLSRLGKYDITAYGLDNDDDYVFNDTVSVDFENSEIIDSLRVFPNPITDHFSIFINSKFADYIDISITNSKGSLLFSTQRSLVSGKNEIEISDIRLIPSLYYLKIRGSTINKAIPLLKISK